jgi:hypothetical protein
MAEERSSASGQRGDLSWTGSYPRLRHLSILNSQFSIRESPGRSRRHHRIKGRRSATGSGASDVLKATVMIDDEIPRALNELSGRHRCIGCLADVPAAEYFANDFMCDECAGRSASFPLASTPGTGAAARETNDEDGSAT